MKSLKDIKTWPHKPFVVFSLITIALYAVQLLADIHYAFEAGPAYIAKTTLTGSLFLAIVLAILIGTIWLLAIRKPKAMYVPWIASAIMCLVLLNFSLFAFYGGRRLAMEADGPATVRYYCSLAELTSTVDVLVPGKSLNKNDFVCTLKNMPIAASNYANWSDNPYYWEYYVITVYLSLISMSYLATKHICERKLHVIS